mgnify:CR=1 FL=1
MLKPIFFIFCVIGIYSCRCDCDCRKNIIYRKAELRLLSNDSFIDSISIRKYNFNYDKSIYDSIFREFYKKHFLNINNYKYTSIDTIYKLDSAYGLSCSESGRYVRDSFFCECAK